MSRRNDDSFPSHPGRPFNFPPARVPEKNVTEEGILQHENDTRKFVHGSLLDASRRLFKVWRGGTTEVVDNLFKRGTDTLDDVQDSSLWKRITSGYVTTGGKIYKLFRSSTDEAAENLFKRGVDTLDDVGNSSLWRKVTAGYVTSAGKIATLFRSSTDEAAENLFKRNVDTFSSIGGSIAETQGPSGRSWVASTVVNASKKITSLWRGGADESPDNLFKKSVDTLDSVQDSSSWGRTAFAYLSGGKIAKILRGGVDESPDNLFKKNVDTLDYVGDGATYHRTSATFVDTAGQVVAIRRNGINESANNLFKKNEDTLDAVGDSASYKRTSPAQVGYADRAGTGLDTNGRLTSGVEKTADIGGMSAHMVSRAQHGVFFETFEELPINWNVRTAAGTASLVSGDGQAGGSVLQLVGGTRWMSFPYNIPFDPSKLYRMRTRVRLTVADSTGSNDLFYAGVEGVGADGTTLVNSTGANSSGSQHYAIGAKDLGAVAVGTWQEFTGWFRGWGATGAESIGSSNPLSPMKLHPSVRYIRPLFILNYNNGTGTTQLDYLAIDVFDELGQSRTYTVLDDNAQLKAGTKRSDGSLFTDLFKKSVDTFSSIGGAIAETQGPAGRSWVADTIVNASKKIVSIVRGGADESPDNLFKKSVDTFSSVGGSIAESQAPASRAWVNSAVVNASKKIISLVRGGADESPDNLFKKTVDTLDSVGDGGTWKRVADVDSSNRATGSSLNTEAIVYTGDQTYDGTVNFRGGGQIAEPGTTIGQSGKRRIEFDTTGSLVMRVLNSLAEGVKVILGNFSVSKGTLTDQYDEAAAWTSKTGSASVSGADSVWVGGSAAVIVLTASKLPSYDGIFQITGKLTTTCSAGGGGTFTRATAYGRVHCYASTDGGATWPIDLGILASDSVSQALGTDTTTFQKSVQVSGSPTNLRFKLVAEAMISGATDGSITASASVDETDANWDRVSWKKSTGTILSRRGVFFGKEAGQPQLTFEAYDSADEPAAADLVEGEAWYSRAAGAYRYFDGSAVQTLLPAQAYADGAMGSTGSAIGTTLASVTELGVPVGANETWEVTWLIYHTMTSTGAGLGMNVVGPSGCAGRYLVEGQNGSPISGNSTQRSATQAIGTSIAAGGFGAYGSTTAVACLKITARVRTGATSGTVYPQLNAAAGTVSAVADSYFIARKMGA